MLLLALILTPVLIVYSIFAVAFAKIWTPRAIRNSWGNSTNDSRDIARIAGGGWPIAFLVFFIASSGERLSHVLDATARKANREARIRAREASEKTRALHATEIAELDALRLIAMEASAGITRANPDFEKVI